MSKILSGRWILTVICGLVFALCSINGLLTKESVVGILTLVFTSYFNKERTQPTEEAK